MERNSRRPSEVDKLQRGLECITKSVEGSKIRIYFQRKKCKQKWCGYFQKVITIIWKKKNEKYALKSVQFLMPRFMEAQLSVVLAIKN